MISILICLAAAAAGPEAPAFDHTHAELNTVLAEYVKHGLVDYAGLKEGRAPLDAYLSDSGAVPLATFQTWSKDEQLAFLINIYNASTLRLIIDHYPIKSIKAIGSVFKGPWAQDAVLLFGKKITLDTLEHRIIRKNYSEPRIHFALVCAAMGCPLLRSEAFVGAKLDTQLECQADNFLGDADKNRVDIEHEKLYLSPIFKWYRDDFEAASGSLVAFVAPYLSPNADLDMAAKYDVEFTDYDWSLNGQDRDQ
ncbi:MAG: DUF547 domain-containing protein [Candidatus Hydrogenedentes bacterium]|nr:DUF547 domain-containing protein [Candidatus Hydrogenedentota bacterium]